MSGFFDGLVAINHLPNNNELFAAYILTRRFDLTSVDYRDAHKIHTSTTLKFKMIYEQNSKVREKVTSFDDKNGISHCIFLPNDEMLIINSFDLNTFTLEVVILFEYKNKHSIFYDGHITDPRIFYNNPMIWDLIKSNKINQLLLDTTSIHIKKFKITETVCERIIRILQSNKILQINLILEEFGHEDLLAALADRGVKIWLDANRDIIFKSRNNVINHPRKRKFCVNQIEAQIFVSSEMPQREMIRKRFEELQIATVAFCTNLDYDKEKSSDSGLFNIKYTTHQTFPDAHFLAEFIGPREIVPIQPNITAEINEIISELKDVCRR